MTLYTHPIFDALQARASDPQTTQKIAVRQVDGAALTYADLWQRVDQVALGLVRRGFQAGDRALLLVRPSVDTMLIVLAVIRAGGTLIIGDPAMGKATFESRMRFAQPSWVFAESLFLLVGRMGLLRGWLKRRGLELPEIGNLGAVTVVNVGSLPFLGDLNLRDLRAYNVEDLTTAPRDPASDAMIVFTSGTTGAPKGVVHTMDSVSETLTAIREYLQLNGDDVFYTAALHLTIPALMAGGAAVLPPRKDDAERTLAAYRQYGVTKTFEVPTHMQAIADHLRATNERLPVTLQTILLGAAPIFPDFLEKLRAVKADSTAVWCIYGMTEILPACAVSLEDKLAFDRRGGDLVGMPLTRIETRIADDGQLLLRGRGLYHRYLGHDPVTWHHTGDIARLDESGAVVLLGRAKDMIIRGNHNIYPALFEPTISVIDGVQAAAMVGVYDSAHADEQVVLFITPAEDATADIVQRVEAALLTGNHAIDTYALPDHIFSIATIPVSGRSRKVDKNALRQVARQRLNLAPDEAARVLDRPQ